MHRKGGHHGFVGTFCLTGPNRKILYRNPSVFRKTSGIEKKMWIRRGISRFSVEVLMCHTAENYRMGSYCFRENFWFKKNIWMKRGVSRISVKISWFHSAEKFCGHPFNVSETLGYRKSL